MAKQEGYLVCKSCKMVHAETMTEWQPKCWVGTIEACQNCGRGFEPEDFQHKPSVSIPASLLSL